MKFYFEGQKIRESKTHHYTHALIKRTEDGVICFACSSSQKGAEKPKNDRIREHERNIANAERRIKALEAGKITPEKQWEIDLKKRENYIFEEGAS